MKKFFIYFLFFNSIFSISQEYKFNLITKYLNTYSTNSMETVAVSNKEDDSYFLTIISKDSKYTGNLFDFNNNLIHSFSIIENKNVNESNPFIFQHIKTIKSDFSIYNKLKIKKLNLEYTDGTYLYYKLIMFKNKKNELIYDLKVLPYSNNMFKLFRFSCLHNSELNENINGLINGLVIKATRTDDNKETTHELVSIINTNFVIKIKN